MLEIILMMLLSSCWSIVIVNYFEPLQQIKDRVGLGRKRQLKSDRNIIDYIIYIVWKVLNCPNCMSYHIFWISYLISYSSLFGIILGVFCYFITHIIKEKIMYVRL